MLYPLIENYHILLQGLFILLLSVFLSALSAPLLIRFLTKKKWGQSIRELGPQTHFSKQGTPTMGGIIFILPPTISILLFFPLNHPTLLIALFAFLALALLGFVDDSLKLKEHNHKGVKPLYKIFFQLGISLFVGIGAYWTLGGNLYIPFMEAPLLNLQALIIPWSIFIIISWSNSVNLTDGLDGLAAGLSVIAMVPLVLIGFLESGIGQIHTSLPNMADGYILSLFLLSIMGSLFVFLWFNGSPAQIFMGDTGSMALGGLLGTCSILLKSELITAFAGILFILESLSVILQVSYYKLTKGKRIFRMAPLHHHFEQGGTPENKIVLRSWLLQTVICILAVLIILYKRF